MENNRYFLMVIGSSKNIDEDLNHIADSKTGVHYVDGNGLFMATFYSEYSLEEVYNLLAHRGAYTLFEINDFQKYGINLPSKYYRGLFPEVEEVIPSVEKILKEDKDYKDESLTDVNDILDKLSQNNFDTSCLTEKELKILNNC